MLSLHRLWAGGLMNTVMASLCGNTIWKVYTTSDAFITLQTPSQQTYFICLGCHVSTRKEARATHFLTTGGRLTGKTIYLGFYQNETLWDQEQMDRVQVGALSVKLIES